MRIKPKAVKSEPEFIARCQKARDTLAEEHELSAKEAVILAKSDMPEDIRHLDPEDAQPGGLFEKNNFSKDLTERLASYLPFFRATGLSEIRKRQYEIGDWIGDEVGFLTDYEPTTTAGRLALAALLAEWLAKEGDPENDWNVTASRLLRRALNELQRDATPPTRRRALSIAT